MDFYRELQTRLKAGERQLEAVTVLEGKRAGEKFLLAAGEKSLSCMEEACYREKIGRRPRMILCGGGHVSIAVIPMAQAVGFQVTVLEDRPRFADAARRAGADAVFCAPFTESLGKVIPDEDTCVVIVTRGHRYDAECLHAVLGQEQSFGYVGMMGSRRRSAIVKRQMEEQGIPEEKVAAVHTPIGLPIGAETPEEIAVSILAEIIQVNRRKERTEGYPEGILEKILEKDRQQAVLATIISRRGSAPRSVGTKMLILEDGSCLGTIGGGCAESEIVKRALQMMRLAEEPKFQVEDVDMTAREAEEEGMVCGGKIRVMLENV